jgi:hypothetical protein
MFTSLWFHSAAIQPTALADCSALAFSNICNRLSKSLVSIARTKVSAQLEGLVGRDGALRRRLDDRPIAAAMSEALRIGGTASWIGRSRRGAMMRSRQSRSAPSLPPRASSTAFRLSASASLSKSASAASVALLRAP